MKSDFVIATGFWRWLLEKLGAAALTMPWSTVYIREECVDDEVLILHEMVHLEQIERYGPVRFSVLYLWWLAKHGYWNNPLEIEAYERQGGVIGG